MKMSELVAEALNFLKDNLPKNETIFVAFSGGKDSIVIADLIRRLGIPFKLYYTQTGIDPPELVRFIREHYPECDFLKPTQSFWHLLTTNNPPAKFSRWCCRELKKKPTLKIPLRHRVIGIRAEESSRRAKYSRIAERDKCFLYYPVFNWNEGDIWEYIEDEGLPYPDIYDQGLNRIGCVICPFHSTADGRGHSFYRKKWPKYFALFEKKCREWFEKRKAQGRKMYFETAEDFLESWYRGKVKWYAHEILPGQQTIDDYL